MSLKNHKGFTIIEALVVTAFIGVILVLAGGITSKFGTRRSIDNVAHKVGSYLNLVKLQAVRNGVEYRTILNFNDTDNEISFKTERGDSNRNSTIFIETSSEILKMSKYYEIIPTATDINFTFSPSSAVSFNGGQILTIKPKNDSNIIRCAVVAVTNFGRIRTVLGRWDFVSSTCKSISDKQES